MSSPAYGQFVMDEIALAKGLKGEALKRALDAALEVKSIKLKPQVTVEEVKDPFQYGLERSYAVVKPYDCGKCDNWHLSAASAWALSEDGIFVTNYHVFEKGPKEGAAIMGHDFSLYPITEILIADIASDFAIVRAKLEEGRKIKAFPVSQSAKVGSEVYLVSHPKSQMFYMSKGHVASYTMRRGYKNAGGNNIMWMMTELGYCPGSSGGGIFDQNGHAVGMVSFIRPTFDIVDPQDKENKDRFAQKVFEYTVPVWNILRKVELEE